MLLVRTNVKRRAIILNISTLSTGHKARMVVIIVALSTLRKSVKLMGKCVMHVTRRDILNHCVIQGNVDRVKVVENGGLNLTTKDNPGRTSMKSPVVIRVMTNWFQYDQESIQVLFGKGTCGYFKANIHFNETDGKGIQRVLTDLTLVKANGPK